MNYRFTWTWITALSFCLAGGCASSAPTRTGESATAAAPAAHVGRSEDSDLVAAFGGQYDSPPLSAYVNEVGNRVAAHCGDHSGAALTFTVLDTPIVNALNGGHGDVYITRGMLSVVNSEDELAGILAHQIGHLEGTRGESNQPSAKPGNQNPENQAPILRDLQVPALRFVIPHAKDHEYQADVVAVQCLASAGYDPRATARLLESIRNFERASAISIGRKPDSVNRLDYLATHVGAIEQYGRALGQMRDRKIAASNHDGYLPHLDGMLYDNRGEFGVVRGLSFARPSWHVRFGMIKGFQFLPQREHVFVIGSSGAFGVMDMAPEPPTGPLSDYIASVWAKGPLELTKLRAGLLRGMEAASAEASVSSPNGTAKLWIFVVRLDPSHVFRVRVHSSAPVNHYDLYAYLKMISTIGTVPETWSVYQQRQIKVVDVQNGDTMASMARRCVFSVEGEEFFRALNGLGARDTLPVRARVKLVVEQK